MVENSWIVIYDGYCNLCSWSVSFIINRDPEYRFVFTASQSSVGKKLLEDQHPSTDAAASVILIKNGVLFEKSSAALEIARNLSGGWKLLYGLSFIPKSVRDKIYMWISGRRYRWFGRKDACHIPDTAIKNRFL
ncbi:MAG: DUF393 domain-containing protein [FCB group bacterium]|nr:DUF393 domain-containing protein [FCB group bacterium]